VVSPRFHFASAWRESPPASRPCPEAADQGEHAVAAIRSVVTASLVDPPRPFHLYRMRRPDDRAGFATGRRCSGSADEQGAERECARVERPFAPSALMNGVRMRADRRTAGPSPAHAVDQGVARRRGALRVSGRAVINRQCGGAGISRRQKPRNTSSNVASADQKLHEPLNQTPSGKARAVHH